MTRHGCPHPCLVVLVAALAGCGGDDATEPTEVYPDFAGTWQFRSALSQGDVVCIEHGDVTIQHAGGSTFSGRAALVIECFEGLGLLSSSTGDVPITGGTFGTRTPRGSWSVSFAARPGWTYQGEAFVAATGSLVIQGTGGATLDPGNGSMLSTALSWTLCEEFVDQADFVERVCR